MYSTSNFSFLLDSLEYDLEEAIMLAEQYPLLFADLPEECRRLLELAQELADE